MASTDLDWLELGFESLRTRGPASITVDSLCREAGRTKGAFYHRFAGIDAYRDALLALWHERATQRVLDLMAKYPDRESRRIALDQLSFELDFDLELAIRAWALGDPAVQKIVNATDHTRIAAAQEVAEPRDSPEEAHAAAALRYAMFLGYVTIRSPEDAARMTEWGGRAVVTFRPPDGTLDPPAGD